MNAPEIRTSRATLRPLGLEDLVEMHALWTHPDVRRYLWDDQIITLVTAEDVLRRNKTLFATEGVGLFGVRLEETGDALRGFAGYWYFHEPPELQILYGLHPDYWGRGLATEWVSAMLAYGFDEKNFSRVVGSTDAPNTASARVMEKAGMRFDKRVTIHGLDTVYYAIEAGDYRARAQTASSNRSRMEKT